MNDQDNEYIIIPGFELVLYEGTNYNTNSNLSWDNSNGTSIMIKNPTGVDTGSSCKLFYKGVEVTISGIS